MKFFGFIFYSYIDREDGETVERAIPASTFRSLFRKKNNCYVSFTREASRYYSKEQDRETVCHSISYEMFLNISRQLKELQK